MQYTPMEQECLDLMNRTNFKAPSKDEIVSLVSKLHQMRPEVAQEIIKQFPEFVSLSEGARGYTVRKVWVDENDLYEARPVYVTVDLFRNGELFDTVTLNEDNNWEHRWYSLDVAYQWRVAERVIPVNYEVRVEYNEKQFLIRNRHNKISDWGEVTRTAKTTTSVSVTTTTTAADDVTSDTGGGIAKTTNPTPSSSTAPPLVSTATPLTTSREDLPQTGQLWWPVLPLTVCGVLLVIIGIVLKNTKDDQ
ncbi:MAG: Cna B-type domain-containing protein [Ruminococcus sp.]|uniref:Cna B-type domain-containing protein n=1 Tax=Ruminococcus sp. TaxID=41978 RepID=UPI0025FE3F05|nr:Cna B-type domain-containing protein [Ruminococcus sp.]MCR5599517.1 Cna B-type domain-containing protein [Ruminococcus sp.]